ncbi:DUF3277 family protein [Apilactobacillus apinorum]|uniref:DUF3277 family protein n=1 Tax=Apilactobacillus apinorum TaxID=1218495 RepID=UPI0006B66F37|nr:DUF3277 family protein [Apilactobacillus apinorum]KOY69001.1 hypothetical protein RZ74_08010 [Apilactobacillus apinorum]CAI2679410.1 Hypothetical protein AAPFHON13_08510 [Apilactobacillus apinorum]
MAFQKDYDVNSAKERSLYLNVYGMTYKCTDLVNGTAASFARATQEFTNTSDYDSKAHFFQSGDKSGTVTVNVLAGSPQDVIFAKLRKAQSSAPTGSKPLANLVYIDNATGETATGTYCVIQGMPQEEMTNNQAQKAYAFLSKEVDNDFDGVSDNVQQLLSD